MDIGKSGKGLKIGRWAGLQFLQKVFDMVTVPFAKKGVQEGVGNAVDEVHGAREVMEVLEDVLEDGCPVISIGQNDETCPLEVKW